jgi:hypothetical protein
MTTSNDIIESLQEIVKYEKENNTMKLYKCLVDNKEYFMKPATLKTGEEVYSVAKKKNHKKRVQDGKEYFIYTLKPKDWSTYVTKEDFEQYFIEVKDILDVNN